MGNASSFSYKQSVDTMLRLAKSRIERRVGSGAVVQVVLVLDEDSESLVLFADVRNPSVMTQSFEWFRVNRLTGSVTSLPVSDACLPVLRSRHVSTNSTLLGILSLYAQMPTKQAMEEFRSVCFNRSGPRDQILMEAS